MKKVFAVRKANKIMEKYIICANAAFFKHKKSFSF